MSNDKRIREQNTILLGRRNILRNERITHILEATAIALGAGILLSVSNFKKLGNGIFASAKETSAIVTCKLSVSKRPQ